MQQKGGESRFILEDATLIDLIWKKNPVKYKVLRRLQRGHA